MTLCTPRSTLFPYTTLFRSRDRRQEFRRLFGLLADRPGERALERRVVAEGPRSEEHTSELQSHSDLVCRLLLEKKKKEACRPSINTVVYAIHLLTTADLD